MIKITFMDYLIEVNELREIQVIKTKYGFKEYIFKKPIKKIFYLKKLKLKIVFMKIH